MEEELVAPASVLFSYRVLDLKEELDTSYKKAYDTIGTALGGTSEQELSNRLASKISKSSQDQDEVNLGLVYGILTIAPRGVELYHLLTLVSQDGLVLVIHSLEQLVMEKYHRLLETPRKQTLWLTGEMVKSKVRDAERIVFALLKQIKGGDTSSDNIWLVEAVLSILIENKTWLVAQPYLVSSAVYSFLCLISEHSTSASLHSLRDEEVAFCVDLLRNRFVDCMEIGKELLRLLQQVARIPEFTLLWKDLLTNPEVLAPGFKGIPQLMKMRTSRRFISSRLTADMEIKLQFISLQVKFGIQKRYQEWFQKKYLSQPSCQFFVADLIRYLCCVVHPPNEVLSSDVIPRWALVGWLLSLCQSTMASSMAKLALFFDFLCYDSEEQTMIMNIEPAVLVMYYSLRNHPMLSSTLLDFLCRIVPNFHPKFEPEVRLSVVSALQDVLQKGVLQSLKPLFESERLDDELKVLVRKSLPEFFPQVPEAPPSSQKVETAVSSGESEKLDLEGEDPEVAALTWKDDKEAAPAPTFQGTEPDSDDNNNENWSDNEDDEEMEVEPSVTWKSEWNSLPSLPDRLRDALFELKQSHEADGKIAVCSKLVCLLRAMKDDEGRRTPPLHVMVEPLWFLTRSHFESPPLKHLTEAEAASEPAYVICREAVNGAVPLSFLTKLTQLQSKLGTCLLTYLATFGEKQNVFESKLALYQHAAKLRFPNEDNPVIKALLVDCQECIEQDQDAFIRLVPVLAQELSETIAGNSDFIQLVASSCDPIQLHRLTCELMMRNFHLFGSNCAQIQETIRSSLEWDTFEQYCLWQMMMAESPSPAYISPLLQEVESENYPEAATGIILYLSSVNPSVVIVESVFRAGVGVTTTAILSHWMSLHYQTIKEAVEQILLQRKESKRETRLCSMMLEHIKAVKISAPNCGIAALSRLISSSSTSS